MPSPLKIFSIFGLFYVPLAVPDPPFVYWGVPQ